MADDEFWFPWRFAGRLGRSAGFLGLAILLFGSLFWASPAYAGGPYAYVTNSGSPDVSVINTATNVVAATVTVGSGPNGVAITPSGSYAYVANTDANTVSV